MPKLSLNNLGQFKLPEDFLQRRNLDPSADYWLDERDGDLIFHPCRPDAKKIYIEVTTVCNLNCQTCIRHSWADPIAHMKEETFNKILDSIRAFPALDRVVLTSFGEPLTHPRILNMIEKLRELKLSVTIGTNGLLLNEKISRELIRLGVNQVVVSIDGLKPETYAGIRGAQLNEVLENIERLNTLKRQLGVVNPTLGIEFVAMKSNQEELPGLSELSTRLGAVRTVVTNLLPYTREMNADKLYGYEPASPFKISGGPVKPGAWVKWGVTELPRMHYGAEQHCRFVNDYAIVVGWDGGVSPCYALSHSYQYFTVDGVEKQVSRLTFGNVNQASLADIWMSEEFVHYRSEVRAFHFPSCADCDLRDTCDLRAKNEACWGYNPSCADCLWAQDIVRCP
ncbi:MAG: tungsten cofactor oxidoreductase radical SAM maturase [Chloroflexi bacterium HGW-Chloroflexi-10]|nr:MAG: tungsten cofactor oxidoreductase radical SAM maturase [Chloroflexi bacterium HGW-Chloroflexi-10]